MTRNRSHLPLLGSVRRASSMEFDSRLWPSHKQPDRYEIPPHHSSSTKTPKSRFWRQLPCGLQLAGVRNVHKASTASGPLPCEPPIQRPNRPFTGRSQHKSHFLKRPISRPAIHLPSNSPASGTPRLPLCEIYPVTTFDPTLPTQSRHPVPTSPKTLLLACG